MSWDLAATYNVSPDFNVFGRVAHRLPRAVDPGPHPLLPRLRGRREPGHQLRLGGRRGGDPVDRDRHQERRCWTAAAPQPRPATSTRSTASRSSPSAASSTPRRCSTPTRPRATASRLDLEVAPTAEWLITLGVSATTTPRSRTPTSRSRPAAAVARSSTRSASTARWSTATACRTRRSGSSTASSTTAGRPATGVVLGSVDWAYHDEKSFFLYESEEFHADAFELGLRFGYLFPDGHYELAALRPQPHRRGDRPERHRLQQPDRDDQRPADLGRRAGDAVLSGRPGPSPWISIRYS